MASDDPRLEDVASAILDGTPVDWGTIASSAGDSPLPHLQHLRVVAAVADVHRTAGAAAEPERSWGPLRLLERIGSGSFGEVYRAWDSRLDREVALKLLPPDAAPAGTASPVIHEGRLLARIHHPNVVTIYGAERIDGRIGLWMEFVRGKTLAQLLDDGRVFTPREVAAMGAELCDALTAVHGAGLLHRDIKAANVMIADDGRVALMDFGTGTDIADASDDLAGTPLYLAPELLAGGEASARSDIYSVGVLLYHLLTRSYPVTADSLTALREAHAHRSPPVARISRRDLPAKMARILDRALDPRPGCRYDSAAALRTDLHAAGAGRRTRGSVFAATAVLLAGVPAWIFINDTTHRPAGTLAGLHLTQTNRLTQTGDAGSAAISPDGSFVVMDMATVGHSSLWIRRLTTGTTEALAAPAPVRYTQLTIAPDARSLFYLRSNRDESGLALYRHPLDPGAEAELVYRGPGLQGLSALSPDGARVALVQTSRTLDESVLFVLDLRNGSKDIVGRHNFVSAYWHLAWSPDGRTLAAVTGTADGAGRKMHVIAVDVDDRSERAITPEPWAFIGRLAWLPDGSGLVMTATREQPRTDQIWLLSYPAGDARRLTDDATRYRGVSVDASATALVTGQVRARRTLWIAPVVEDKRDVSAARRIDTAAAREITSGWGRLSWTPDGDIVFSSTASGTPNIWRAARDGTRPRQLTRFGINNDPTVSADGKTIVFESIRGDGSHLWRMDADGGNAVQLTTGTGEGDARITPDSRWVIFNSLVGRTLWRVPLQGGAPTRITQGLAQYAAVSPDGRWIAYNARAPQPPGPWRITIMPADGGRPWKVFTRPATENRTQELHWTPDGTAITYEATHEGVSNIWSQPLSGGPPTRATNFTSDYIYGFAWSPDGTHLALLRGAFDTDIVLYSFGR